MSKRIYPKTTSQALRTIGRISAIEEPIRSGLIGFHKAKSIIGREEEEKEEMERHLVIFKSFCFTFERVVSFEQERDASSLEKWLTQKGEPKPKSRIDTYVGIRSFLRDSDARNSQLKTFKGLCSVADKILRGEIDQNEVKASIDELEKVRRTIEEKLGPEKKTSEKILSGRAPFI